MSQKQQPRGFVSRILAAVLRPDVETRVLKEGKAMKKDKDKNDLAQDVLIREESYEYDEAEIAKRKGALDFEEGAHEDYEVAGARPKANLSRLAQTFDVEVDDATARQRMRRIDAFERLLKGMSARAEPSGKVMFVTIPEATELMKQYQQARTEGYEDKDLEIVPLSSYQGKLFPEGKKPVRPLLENEWGVVQAGKFSGTIICIRDRDLGTGAGDAGATIQVPGTPQPSVAESSPTKKLIVEPAPGLLPGPGEESGQ